MTSRAFTTPVPLAPAGAAAARLLGRADRLAVAAAAATLGLAALAGIAAAGPLRPTAAALLAALGAAAIWLAARERRRRQALERTLAPADHGCNEAARLAGDWIWESDTQHRFTRLNGETVDQLIAAGIGPQDVIGKTRWEVAGADPLTDPKWRDHKAEMDARRPFRHFRYTRTTPAGERRHIVISGDPVFDESGAFRGYRGSSTDETPLAEALERAERAEIWLREDIAALTEAQEALRRSEAELRSSQRHLVQAQRVAGLGSAEIDLRTGRGIWSDEAYRILGVPIGDADTSFERFLGLVHKDDREKVLRNLEGARERGEAAPIEYRIHHPSGDIRTIYREACPLREEDGKIVTMIATLRDVTEERAAARRRRELEAQLAQKQRLEALGTLAGGIAHDLNNTLVPVVALSKRLATRSPEGSAEAAQLTLIHEAGSRARDLVKQVLAFSRREETRKEPLDLDDFIRQSLAMVRASVPATIALDYAAAAGLPKILADRSQLHQVLINLVTNAVHAIGEAPGTLSIRLAEAAAGEGLPAMLRLAVRDTGCGMDAATQRRIFEPFFTTKGVGEGSGLGLAVVHGIVSGHGGRIAVTSAPGAGTEFEILLPAVSCEL